MHPQRRGFDPWVGKIPWRRKMLPTPVFWPREFHGLYSPQGHKESDMTEQLSLSLSFLLQLPQLLIFSFLWLGHFTVQPYLLSSHSCACFDFSFRAGKVVCLLILFPPKFPRRAYREIQVIQMWNTVVWFLVQSLIIKNCCMILNSLVDISKHQSILHL